jgi:eukaryotic-like serine/threonine-protein kinase
VARVLANRYALEVPLGRGATGEVWRGRDLATHQPVAVKIFQLEGIESSAAVAETIARFRREAATLARLRHPNIVAALEAGRIGDELFLVMELADGTSLASMLDQRLANNLGLLPVSSVLRIAEHTCAGLAAAHSAGVVHRDIKPSNLMVATRLSTKIIDFGIARLLDDNATVLTLHAVGTLAYISPEQLQNRKDVDGRADLYSLGCVLYEQLAGRPPFVAEVPTALLVMHVKQQADPLDSIRSDLPLGLARLVDHLMEKDRSRRPHDASEVLSYLAAINAEVERNRPAREAAAPGPAADRTTQRAPIQPADAATAGRAAEQRAQPSFVPRSPTPGPRETKSPPPQALSSAAYQATELFAAQGPQFGAHSGHGDRGDQRPAGLPPRPGQPPVNPRRPSGWRAAVSTLIGTISGARRRSKRRG